MFVRLRKYFITGLVVFLPIALTIYLFFLAIDFTDNLLGKYLEPYFYSNFGFYFKGLGIVVGIYIIILIGFVVTNFFGKKIYDFFDHLIIKLPFFKQIYPALKEMASFLFARDKMASFRKVVIVEYPRKGIYAIAFLTNDSSEKIRELTHQKELCNIFIPSAPQPLTGYVMLIPKKDLIQTDMTVEEAFKLIVSGGVVNPG